MYRFALPQDDTVVTVQKTRVYRDACRVVSGGSNATACRPCRVQREEGRAAHMAGEIAMGPGSLQGRDWQSALLSRALARIAAEGRAEVGQWDAGWQGCASPVEWRRVGAEHKDVGRLRRECTITCPVVCG
jgi:hypothetical protein